jgi:branched-chain amino acid transport system permease protein
MSGAVGYYVTTLLVYAGVSIIACWGLNLQFGQAGILNFGFVAFQAIGAYTAAVLTLGPSSEGISAAAGLHYVAGATLPYPVPILAAMVVSAAVSVPIGFVVLRKLRSDYQAIALLVVSLIAITIAESDTGLVNGSLGLSGIPRPFLTALNLGDPQWQWFYCGLIAVFCVATFWFIRRTVRSPLGRVMRATREDEISAAALGKNVFGIRLATFVAGNTIAALSGALLVEFVGAWAPNGWGYDETFVYLAAIIIGGTANQLGVVIGAIILPVGISEGVRYLPAFGGPNLIDALQWILFGLLMLVFLWFWPRGIVPERRNLLSGLLSRSVSPQSTLRTADRRNEALAAK